MQSARQWWKVLIFLFLIKLQKQENAWLIIDESHTLGVYGKLGTGVSQELNLSLKQKTIFVSSLNKALGIPGGMIWGNKLVTDTLRKSPWFAGASPPAPAYVYTLKRMLETNVFSQALSVLTDNISYLNKKLPNSDLFLSVPEYPVLCSENAALFDHLLKYGIMASCFSYPLPTDVPVTRLAISAVHQKEDLDRLAEVCGIRI
jgi:8-amino-7-oxononanoate synthase